MLVAEDLNLHHLVKAQFDRAVKTYRERWRSVRSDDPEIPVPDLRTAAHTLAVQRCRHAALQRGVWP